MGGWYVECAMFSKSLISCDVSFVWMNRFREGVTHHTNVESFTLSYILSTIREKSIRLGEVVLHHENMANVRNSPIYFAPFRKNTVTRQ